MKKTIAAMVGTGSLFLVAQGCALKTGDADKFREPIPQAGDASLKVPGSQVSGGSTQSMRGVKLQGGGSGGGAASDSVFYSFTRDVCDGVDWGTAIILGVIVAVTDNPPTTIDDNHAVWGPGSGNALDPITWKLVATRVATDEYDYEIDGRPHLSTSDADWKTILTGHGWGKAHPSHKSGWFLVDNDAFRSLDPQRGHDTGTVKVTFDARAYPITITAEAKSNDGTGTWFTPTVTHQQDGSGELDISAFGDVDSPKDGTNENVGMHSRWNSLGAGRADVKISGGNLPVSEVDASECWSDAYARTYYTDNVNYRQTVGDASTCAFGEAQFR